LWPMLAELPATFREARRFHEIWDVHEDNLLKAGLLVAVAAGIGWVVLRAGDRPNVKEAVGDYREASGGALPDGHVETGDAANGSWASRLEVRPGGDSCSSDRGESIC